MASRMTTLDYEEQPFNPNRPDAEIDPGDSGEHPRLLPTIEMRAQEPFPLAPSVARTLDDRTQPSLRAIPRDARVPALPGMFVGMAIAAAILLGLALFGINAAYANALSTGAYVFLLAASAWMLGAGISALIAAPTLRYN